MDKKKLLQVINKTYYKNLTNYKMVAYKSYQTIYYYLANQNNLKITYENLEKEVTINVTNDLQSL